MLTGAVNGWFYLWNGLSNVNQKFTAGGVISPRTVRTSQEFLLLRGSANVAGTWLNDN
jgi:hypothetical protein